MSAGIRRTQISALSHGSSDFLIVAVIIAKQTPRTIKSKNVDMRSVWNFTLRDAPADYINVSFWGSSIFIDNIAQNFHIGDVVDIIKAKATFRKNDNTSFVPDVTSPLVLTMSENISEMCLHSEDDCAEFHQLLRLPTRPPGDYITLSDVHANGQALKGKHVNLLVAVRSVGALRQVTTKQEGKVLECREVEMMDQSPTCLYIQLWDAEMAYRADNWKPRETVLFIADVRLNWNSFKKCMTATVTSRTIITENPDMADAEDLREHARNAPIVSSAILDQFATNFPEREILQTYDSVQNTGTHKVLLHILCTHKQFLSFYAHSVLYLNTQSSVLASFGHFPLLVVGGRNGDLTSVAAAGLRPTDASQLRPLLLVQHVLPVSV
ncbi:hypothetical protein J6590_089388 [Homalodisca vitripennis]|nr:hypothetical protein J6590_089388 [Homalodisca vitripennis]